MGRGKLQLKLIEDKNSRHVTFSKRRSGLIKKAQELSVLCDVDVAVFVYSGKGKRYQFSSGDRCFGTESESLLRTPNKDSVRILKLFVKFEIPVSI